MGTKKTESSQCVCKSVPGTNKWKYPGKKITKRW